MIKNIILLISFAFIFTTCSKEDETPIYITVTPSGLQQQIEAFAVINYKITCTSKIKFKSVVITSKEEKSHSKIELDTLIDSNIFNYNIEYSVPEFIDTLTTIYFRFQVTDANDFQLTETKVLLVKSDRKLEETAGHELFSHASTKEDAYNLELGSPLHWESADSLFMHILENSDPEIHNEDLSRKFTSPAEIKFVKFNDFDYANASIVNLKNSYNSGIKHDFIENINEGDIYLTNLGEEKYLSLKIINIIDNAGVDNDKYIFNIKK